MPAEITKLRIFIASPKDVFKERERLHTVVDELNLTGGMANELGITLEALDWQTHVSPFVGQRPEQVILDQLPVKMWDIFIGILWTRFGTPSGGIDPDTGMPYDSGTAEEFSLACKSSKKNNRPQILFYRCNRPAPMDEIDAGQLKRVQDFFKEFRAGGEHPGLPMTFKTTLDFERRVRQDLTRLVIKYSKEVLKKDTRVFETVTELPADDATDRYVGFVRKEHGNIKLFGFLSAANIDVRLLDVFVSLRFSEHWREMEMKRLPEMRERGDGIITPPRMLSRAIQKKRALLILGGPGSGKTTLLKYFSICCLDHDNRERINLRRPLIPILVPLRQIDPTKPFTEALSFWAEKHHYLRMTSEQFEAWLHQPGALVLLDGLDEISDLATRKNVCQWIDRAIPTYGNSTFVITCRFTGYREADGVSLKSAHLRADVRDLDAEQQAVFLKQWFAAARRESLTPEEESDEALLQEIEQEGETQAKEVMDFLNKEENASLRDMASIPVLLQIMAIIWKEQGSLSGERVELYGRSMDFLLDHRDKAKGVEPLVSATKARLVLRPLALWMQETLHKDEAVRDDIEKRIAEKIQEVRPGATAEEFLNNIRDRAGVLVGSGADTFMFQHKSFREFLSAIEIANQQKAELLVQNFGDDWWRETLLFAAGVTSPEIFPAFIENLLKSEKNAGPTSPLLLQLVREAATKPLAPFEKVVRNQKLVWQKRYNALQCLRLLRSPAAEDVVKQAQNDKQKEVQLLANEILREWGVLKPEAVISEKAGRFFNPLEENAEYILIPGGKYKYSVKKTGTELVEVPPLYFAKYPVTNKLYRRFIDYLAEEKKVSELLAVLPREQFAKNLLAEANRIEGFVEYIGKDHRSWAKKLRSNYNGDKQFNGDEQPVVGVSWFAVTAYCHWLSELQKANGKKKKEKSVEEQTIFKLPTEEEWEWAASGGKRIYPWGDKEPDEALANFGQKVGHTTPVGAYPAGATPEGLMDMAGNVWEWMENLYGKGAYAPEARALRGGSWYVSTEFLRCAARSLDRPDSLWDLNGFRVVCGQSFFETL